LKNNTPLPTAQIADSLQIPRSSTYKYISILKKYGFVDTKGRTGKYELGVRFLDYAAAVNSQVRLEGIALPYMKKLVQEAKESVILAVLDNEQARCIEGVAYGEGIIYNVRRGTYFPLHCGALAKVLLAYLPEKQIDSYFKKVKLIPYTHKSVTDPRQIKESLLEIKRKGFSYSDQEYYEGSRGIAAPIFDYSDQVISSLAIVGPVIRIKTNTVTRLKGLVIKCAKEISAKLKEYRFVA
jgi:DNA-binding IclR family transcriptional regulator